MPFISEVSSIYIQRMYTGLITLRNQLVTPIKLMGRRVIELYDALISGNDWEVTTRLSLKRRAGHTLYVSGLTGPALNLYSWKTNTMGTIPIIDTTADIEYVNSSGTTTSIYTKSPNTQSSILGIGNFLYVGNQGFNFKWDGPSGQGVTNWGISQLIASFGPNTAGSGQNQAPSGSPVPWTNPGSVTGSATFASVTLPATVGALSDFLLIGTFGFAIPAGTKLSGIQVTFTASYVDPSTAAQWQISLLDATSGGQIGIPKLVPLTPSPVTVTLGGPSDLWGASSVVASQVNGSSFGLNSFLSIPFGSHPIGSTGPTAQIQLVKVTLYSGGTPSVTPTGSGSFTAVNGYTYVYAYGNVKSGEVSNASLPSVNTGPFTNVAYVGVPVTASTDTQVNQIRVYRITDSGGGNQFFEIANSPFPNTTATIQDTTIDTNLQVTSQAEINLGNTPPPSGLINMEWFSGRMWGSVGNVLYASTGPETLSGTAPQSNWNPQFQWVFPGTIVLLKTGPNGMLVQTNDDCFIVRGTDITNYTVNHIIRDFGLRTINAADTDGTNLYEFTSDRQFIQVSASGANDIGLPIADQLAAIDPTACYVKINRYGLDSIVRILDTVNNLYYDFNLNQQCWNLPGLLQMPGCTAMGSIETSPGVWRLIMCSTVFTGTPPVFVSATLAYRDINNFQDLGTSYAPVAVFGSIQLADPGNLAKFGARGGITLEYTSAGLVPNLSVLPNDAGVTLTNVPGAQVTGPFVSLSVGKNPVPDPPTLGMQPQNYRSLRYYWLLGKGLSAFVRHFQFQIVAAKENQPTELIGFGIFGDEKMETGQPGKLPELQGR